ncbi:hypothetical protein SAMN05661012_04166 [Chitinophaga sancti]|uniref:Uncharacterized protein n=1 Tax=Chitinophaga sancti TaxID=1004 RepID=A0A1K1RRF9_9BACT|nr:hypothetical protein SAMN05661012_04166 [Chitinophaga sancti]
MKWDSPGKIFKYLLVCIWIVLSLSLILYGKPAEIKSDGCVYKPDNVK